MAEFWRALKTLKALQAEQAASTVSSLEAQPLDPELKTPAARPPLIDRAQPHEPEAGAELRLHHMVPAPPAPGHIGQEPAARWQPNQPERGVGRRLEYVSTEASGRGRALHEPAAPWLPNEPDNRSSVRASGRPGDRAEGEPHARLDMRPAP